MGSADKPSQFVNEQDGSELVLLPEGEFLMGSDRGFHSERPVHRAYVDAFYLATHPVTNAQYHRFVTETGHRVPFLDDLRATRDNWDPEARVPPGGRERHPVVLVSWHDANAYCEWAGGRLPTEAEWEKAARGGLEGRDYPWGDEINPSLANYDNAGGTTAVCSYPPNNYRLFDMAGNVWEWVSDRYSARYYAESADRNPLGPEAGAARVLRGGASLLFARFCRVSYRFRNSPDFRFSLIGFRLAAEAAGPLPNRDDAKRA